MKKWIVLIVIIVVVVAGVVWYFEFRKPATSSTISTNPDLEVINGPHINYTVSATSIGNYLPLVGQVTSNVYNIGPYISGQITNVYVRQGQLIGMNQPLAKLNPTQYRLNYIQALNNYYNALLTRAASSVIEQYRLALQLAQENLNYTTITSPATGFIQTLNVATGDFVNAQTSSANLITIIQNTNMWVNAYVSEVDLADVHVGQKAIITFTQLNNLQLTGTVSFVQPFATTQSGLTVIPISIKFDKDPSKYGVVYGLDCNVNLIISTSKGFLIPFQAVFTDQDGQRYVLLKTSSGYQRQPVVLGNRYGMMVQVTSGVKEGDILIMKALSQTQNNAFRGLGFVGR
ncbi:MAG: efflux RND transporter periplasmic adaptor subunit [Athalassotoga sp.]|uniref:efflux RND transporter periplasmic adaptor subunit n=1 Tax=Athalassotoga sp. TaxID=2022597 RepID=UPI003CFE7541